MSSMESTAALSPLQSPATALRAPGTIHAVDGSASHVGDLMSRSERFGFWMYVAMGVFCMAVVIAAATSALLA